MTAVRSRLTPGGALVVLAAVALLLYPVVSDSLYYQNMIILSLVFAIGAVGLNVISGYGGYISLGQGAFLGLGAYTLAILSTRVEGVSVWVWVPQSLVAPPRPQSSWETAAWWPNSGSWPPSRRSDHGWR